MKNKKDNTTMKVKTVTTILTVISAALIAVIKSLNEDK